MILNDNQRSVAQLMILGKNTEEIMSEIKLTRQTVNRIKRELEEHYRKVYMLEERINKGFVEMSKLESDMELIKNVFMKRVL